MELPPNLPIKIRNPISPGIQLQSNLPPKKPFVKRKLILPIFGILAFLLIFLGVVFSRNISSLLGRLGVYNLMRSVGLLRPDVPSYFAALQDQNPLYDLNKDGTVSGDDYALLVSDLDENVTAVGAYDVVDADEPAAGENQALPSVRAFSTDSFTGSSTVSYPIELPGGTGGLTPSLSVSYSSSSVDDLFVGTDTNLRNDPSHSYQRQAGILGLGWNLGGMGSISRDHNGTFNNPSDDTFILAFAGGAANLTKESGDETYSLWRTVPNLKLKVERWGRCKTHEFQGGSWSICRYHWQVTDGRGFKYYFGSPSTVNNWKRPNDPDAQYFPEGVGNDWYPLYDDTSDGPIGTRKFIVFGSTRQGLHALTTTWLLSKVESVFDVNGSREVEINYFNVFEFGAYRSKNYVSASYPKKLTWGNHEVNFILEPRLDSKIHSDTDDTPDQPQKSANRLKKIIIKTLGKVFRAYTFDYNYGWDPTKHTDDGDGIAENSNEVVSGQAIHSLLSKVTTWSDDPSVNSTAKRLPSYSFSYGENCGVFKGGCPLSSFVNDDTATQEKTPNDFFLTSADNGLNGKVAFEYWSNSSGGNALETRQCDADKLTQDGSACKTDHEKNVARHRVATKVINDGMGNTIRNEIRYTGAGENTGLAYVKKYSESWCSGQNCNDRECNPDDNNFICRSQTADCSFCNYDRTNFSGFEFLGYPEVETYIYKKNSIELAAKSKSFYNQAIETTSCFKPSPLKGVAYKTQIFNADNLNSWTETENKFKVRFGPMFGAYTEKVDTDLASYCTNYNPETTVSLVMATDTISKSLMPNPQLCTKTSTDHNNANGSIDHYALPHKTTNFGKVSCTNTSLDDTSDLTWYSLTEYTSANTTKWLLPLPKETWDTQNTTTKYKHSRMYYDQQVFGSLGSYGQLTKSEVLVNGTLYSTNTIEYNTSYPWLVWRITDPNGKRTTTDYDSVHHLYPIRVTNHLGQRVATEYDFNTADTSHPNRGGVLGLPVKITDANNATTTTVYDAFGRSIEVYLPGKSPGTGVKPNQFTKYYYFNQNEVSPCTEANNCLIGLGTQVSNQFGPKMMVASSTRVNDSGGAGKVTTTHSYFNGLGQNIQTRQTWYENEWNNAGIPVDGEGLKDLVTSTTFTSLGQQEYQSLPYTAAPYVPSTTNSYDSRNFVTDNGILETKNSYDGFGRLKQTFYPDGTSEETVYEVDGNPLKTKFLNKNCKDSDAASLCAENIVTTNAFSQVVDNRQIEQSGKTYTTSFETHPILGVLSVRDTLGNTVSKMEYDLLGRKIKMWDIDMSPGMLDDANAWRYTYDKLGNLVTQTDPKNRLSELTYDDLYRLRTQKVAGTTLLENTYDTCPNGKGRLCITKSYNLQGATLLQNKALEYDNRGRLTKETVTLSNMPDTQLNNQSLSTSYTYDEGGRVLTTTYPSNMALGLNSETITHNYNKNWPSGLTSSISSLTYASNARYNENSQILGLASGNGVINNFTYRSDNLRLNSLRVEGNEISANQKLMLSYRYDPVGNITKITDDNTTKTSQDKFYLSQDFTYDALQRLKSTSGAYTATYSYDDIGNILGKNEGGEQVSLSYSYNSASYHRPSNISLAGFSRALTYDEVGNLLGDNKNDYTYDANNRLIGALPGLSVNLSADPQVFNSNQYTTLTAVKAGSTSSGSVEYNFDCEGDGIYEYRYTSDGSSISHRCSNLPAGTYNSAVIITREGISAQDSVILTVNTCALYNRCFATTTLHCSVNCLSNPTDSCCSPSGSVCVDIHINPGCWVEHDDPETPSIDMSCAVNCTSDPTHSCCQPRNYACKRVQEAPGCWNSLTINSCAQDYTPDCSPQSDSCTSDSTCGANTSTACECSSWTTSACDGITRLLSRTCNLSSCITQGGVTDSSCINGFVGDANRDGVVDNLDYNQWLAHYSQSVGGGSDHADFSLDGVVDGVDYSLWRRNFGAMVTQTPTQPVSQQIPTSTPASVPSVTLAAPTSTPAPTATPVTLPACSTAGGTCRSYCYRAETQLTGYSCSPSTYVCCRR